MGERKDNTARDLSKATPYNEPLFFSSGNLAEYFAKYGAKYLDFIKRLTISSFYDFTFLMSGIYNLNTKGDILDYLLIYSSLIRTILVILSIYYICKHDFKSCMSTATAFAVTFLPSLLGKVFDIKLDAIGSFLYISIIFMTMYLGNVLRFYDKYRWWDMLMHFISGIVFVSFGIALAKKLNNPNIIFSSFTFSATLNVLWEVLEYSSDCIFNTNTQRWKNVDASGKHVSEMAQPAGLKDTMNDLIICIIGTSISCIIWWFILMK